MSLEVKKQAEVKETKRFTGCIPFQVVAINPSKAELESLGVTLKDEPTYKGEKDGYETLRIDFWLRNTKLSYVNPEGQLVNNETLITKGSLWLENIIQKSKTGKVKIVNDYARDTWADSVDALKANPNMSWYPTEGIREAYAGEAKLLETLYLWLGYTGGNKDKDIPADKIKLSKSISEIIKSGDVSELKGLIKSCLDNGNGLKYLAGVQEKDGKFYQTLCMDYPMRPSVRNYDKLNEYLSGEYNPFKADYQNSFDVKLYTGKPTIISQENTFVAKPTTASPF